MGLETCRVNPASLFFSALKETVQNLNWSESPEVTLLTEWTVKSVQAKTQQSKVWVSSYFFGSRDMQTGGARQLKPHWLLLSVSDVQGTSRPVY